MQTSKVIIVLIMCLLLTGCSKEEEPVVETSVPDLRAISNEVTWNDLYFKSFTDVTAIETSDDVMNIFPYNNNDAHITVKRVLLSNNGFWKTITLKYKDTDNYKSTRNYSLVTFDNSSTYGYLKFSKDEAFVVFSENLPSSYVELVLEILWNLNT